LIKTIYDLTQIKTFLWYLLDMIKGRITGL